MGHLEGGHYKRIHNLGRGTHGSVSLAIDTNTGDRVAIKAVKRKDKRADQHRQLLRSKAPSLEHHDLHQQDHIKMADQIGTNEMKIRREIAIMRRLDHPNIVKLIDVLDDPLEKKVYIVLEYMAGGDIEWRTRAGEPVQTVRQATRVIRDVMLGLIYLHRQGIVHRDIKPANLLWTADRMTVKISDFGVSLYVLAAKGSGHKTDKDADFEELMSDKFLNRLAGTPAFLAPELCSLSPPPTPSPEHSSSSRPITTPTTPEKLKYLIDVWALGVTYYCLLFGHPPWEEAGEFQLYKRISTEDFPMADLMGSDKIPTGGRRPTDAKIYPDGVSVLGILDGLLQKDPRKRLSLKVLKDNDYVNQDIRDMSRWKAHTAHLAGDITVTEKEERSAVTRVHWRSRVAKGLRLIRTKISGQGLAEASTQEEQSAECSRRTRISQNSEATGGSTQDRRVDNLRVHSMRQPSSGGLGQKVKGFLQSSLASGHRHPRQTEHILHPSNSRHSLDVMWAPNNRTTHSLGPPSPYEESLADTRRIMSDGDGDYLHSGEDSSSDDDYGETEGDRVQRELVGAGGLPRSQATMSDDYSSHSSPTPPRPPSPYDRSQGLRVAESRYRTTSPLSHGSYAEAEADDDLDDYDDDSVGGPRHSVYSGSSSSNTDSEGDSDGHSGPVELKVRKSAH